MLGLGSWRVALGFRRIEKETKNQGRSYICG